MLTPTGTSRTTYILIGLQIVHFGDFAVWYSNIEKDRLEA